MFYIMRMKTIKNDMAEIKCRIILFQITGINFSLDMNMVGGIFRDFQMLL